MSHLKYFSYAGHGERVTKDFRMEQSVRVPVGETITISGQGGWDRETSIVPESVKEEWTRAFENVNHAMVDAGGKGMSQVYKLVMYTKIMDDETMNLTRELLEKWFPNHRPIVSVFGVNALGLPGMRVEIEAWAHLG